MPFVGTKRAKDLYNGKIKPKQVGDLCAIAYTTIIRQWRKKPSWTTVHKVIKPMLPGLIYDIQDDILNKWSGFDENNDATYAVQLAYEVFFGLYILDYERKKRKENGDVY